MIMVTPNLHYPGTCKKAIELYRNAFGAEVKMLITNNDADPDKNPDEPELIWHSEIYIGNQRLTLNDDTTGNIHFGQTVSMIVTFETAADVEYAYKIIKDGGTIVTPMEETSYSSCFVSIIDKYGVRWELMTEQTDQ